MIPLFKVRMSPTISDELEKVFASGYIAQGPKVDEFEREVGKALGLPVPPTAVNSGTSALDLALDIIGVGPGDEVITTPMTCFATNINIIRRGATIVWADVYSNTGLINPFDVAGKITRKTKAIIGVDWAGQFADYGSLKAFGIPVIEDAAHVFDVNGVNAERGDYIMYSLQAIKFLTTGDGGLLITPDEETRKMARSKRWYGLDRDNDQSFRSAQDIDILGTKCNMNDISATIGLSNIRYAINSVHLHTKNAKTLTYLLKDIGFAKTVPFDFRSSYWMFPLVMRPGIDRNLFEAHMLRNGIQIAQVHTRNDVYTVTKPFRGDFLAGLDNFSRRQINIPCGWWMTEADIEYVADTIKKFGRPNG